MILTPTGNRVLVKEVAKPDLTEAGIWLPPATNEQVSEGIVEAVGSRVLEVKVGDKILFSRPAATVITVGRVEHLFIEENRVYTRELSRSRQTYEELADQAFTS